MKNITLLSRILKITNELITSEEFKAKYRIENSFSRKRKLSFVNSVYFILSGLRKSISTDTTNILKYLIECYYSAICIRQRYFTEGPGRPESPVDSAESKPLQY